MSKKIILDTDVGSDCDDMLAIALLAAENVDVRAVTYASCLPNIDAPAAIRAAFRFVGMTPPPLGAHEYEKYGDDHYSKAVAERFAIKSDFAPCETPVRLLRKTLAGSDGLSICTIGLFTNIAALLESEGDDISEMNGIELMRSKCTELISMAGCFREAHNGERYPEWNVKQDISASKTVFEKCPVPITLIPWELGDKMISGEPFVKKYGERHPVTYSFLLFNKTDGGRQSWDPATVLYAAEGLGNYFLRSENGKITVDEKGVTYFEKSENGNHSYLSVNCTNSESEEDAKKRVACHIDRMVERVIKA